MSNKVKFGLKNVHYAVITELAGAITYGTPVKIPGAVNLVLNPKGDKSEFYADDMAYFVATANQGYEGTLEMALLPDEFRIAVLKDKKDANDVIFEDSKALPIPIALLYEFAGDVKATRHVNYNVAVARPNIESGTQGATIDPKTDTLNIIASPASDTGYVKAKMIQGTPEYEAFYSEVYKFVAVQE